MPAAGVSSIYLMKGAMLALEQCGLLLRDASTVYGSGSRATAVVLAEFAREEFGRARLLFGLRAKVVAGQVVTIEQIKQACREHVDKQTAAVVSTVQRADNTSGLGKLLQSRFNTPLQTEERDALEERLNKINEKQRKRAPHDRHLLRTRSLYVDPDNSTWNRPVLSVSQEEAHNLINDLANDYAGGRQKVVELELEDDGQLRQEITDWSERPELPRPAWVKFPSA